MNRVSVVCISALTCAVLSGAGWRENRIVGARDARRAAEIARLRAHFDSVDLELRARTTVALTADQQARRTQLISWLRDYRNRGLFPINDRFANRAVPFFRDSHGTLCAMAYLIDRSGSGDLVDRIARTENNAFIREIADDPALVTWLAKWGLSAAEAARIQPSYGGNVIVVEGNDKVSSGYALGSLALGAASVATGTMNLVSPTRASGVLGILVGAGDIAIGASKVGENKGTKKLSLANITIGAASVLAGVRGLMSAPISHQAGQRRLTLSPDILLSSGVPRAGVLATARF